MPLRAAFRSVIDDGEEINLALSDEVRVRKSAKDAWSEHFAERFVFHLAAPNLTTEAVNPQLSPHVNGTFVAQSGPARRNLLYRLDAACNQYDPAIETTLRTKSHLFGDGLSAWSRNPIERSVSLQALRPRKNRDSASREGRRQIHRRLTATDC